MRSTIMRSINWLAPVATVVAAFGASAAPILVNFESDPAPANVINGFESSDSSLIQFSDTDGADLIILEVDASNALAVFFDDDSGLLMNFDFVASELSLDFGNTSLASLGDTAVLTVLMGGIEVGSSVLALNLTDQIDQTISFDGVMFNSATFKYNVAAGLTEVVDNLRVVNPIPEPRADLLFGMGALLVGAVRSRRSPTEG